MVGFSHDCESSKKTYLVEVNGPISVSILLKQDKQGHLISIVSETYKESHQELDRVKVESYNNIELCKVWVVKDPPELTSPIAID